MASAEQTVVLITGANGGIGFELASQLLSDPFKYILLGSRSVEKGEAAVNDLQARNLPGTVEFLQVDVTSEESIAAAAKSVESKHGRLDALVNNAAVYQPEGSLASQMRVAFQTNTTGPLLMVESFAYLLKKSIGTPRIVNVSSEMSSITRRLEGSPGKATPYRATKASLNMITACQAVEYADSGFKVFAYDPGFTVSNLAVHCVPEYGAKPPSEAAAPMVEILDGKRDAEHATLFHANGRYDW